MTNKEKNFNAIQEEQYNEEEHKNNPFAEDVSNCWWQNQEDGSWVNPE